MSEELLKFFIFGETASGLPIPAYSFGSSAHKVLIIAGLHGNDKNSIIPVQGLLAQFAQSFSYKLQVDLVPALNFDGLLTHQFPNHNNVDLNRNLPTNEWIAETSPESYSSGTHAKSETETQAFIQYLEDQSPSLLIHLHSLNNKLIISGRCKAIAEKIADFINYEVESHPTDLPSRCLQTYCGSERDLPTLSYGIEKELETPQVLQKHLKAIIEGLKVLENRT